MSTALVTGATSGIGLEFARALAARGDDLVLVARDAERLQTTAGELRTRFGAHVEVLVADLVERDQLASVEERLADPERPVETLVNNAGFGLKRGFADNTVEQEQAHLDVLVVAVMRLMHAALGPMLVRGSGQVVNVASVSAFFPRGSYGAAKAYVVSLSEWAHHEYARRGVQVMVVCPGFVKTEFHQRIDVSRGSAPAWMWLAADDVVAEALHDLDAGKAVSIPSRRYRALIAGSRAVPTFVKQRFASLGRR